MGFPLFQSQLTAQRPVSETISRSPGIIPTRDFRQILLVQQGQLQGSLLRQWPNRRAGQRRDPSQPGMLFELVDLRLGQQPTISHHQHSLESEPLPQLSDLL